MKSSPLAREMGSTGYEALIKVPSQGVLLPKHTTIQMGVNRIRIHLAKEKELHMELLWLMATGCGWEAFLNQGGLNLPFGSLPSFCWGGLTEVKRSEVTYPLVVSDSKRQPSNLTTLIQFNALSTTTYCFLLVTF